MKKSEFMKYLDKAIRNGYGIQVCIRMPDLPEVEKIYNPPANVEIKKAYYDKTYNDDMEMIAVPSIKIVEVVTVQETMVKL